MTGTKSDLVVPAPTVFTHLVEALRIIDECGQQCQLPEKDWNALRMELIDALLLFIATD